MSAQRARAVLLLILLLYFVLASLYAIYTPAWQAPDEPAHYNYVRYLAENGRFPVLQQGDYVQTFLDRITAVLPPDMSIAGIRYESHQPPLYYVLAAPVYLIFSHVQGPWATPAPGLLPLRLFSVLQGAGLVLLAYESLAAFFRTGRRWRSARLPSLPSCPATSLRWPKAAMIPWPNCCWLRCYLDSWTGC